MDHHGGKREQEQEYADKTDEIEDFLPLPDLVVRIYLLITRRHTERCIEEVYDIAAACMGEVVERVDLIILIDNADALLAVYRAGINLMVFNGADVLLVKLVYERRGIGILQIGCGVAVLVLEEPFVILCRNNAEVDVYGDGSVNAFKFVVGVGGIVALVESRGDAVDAAGCALLEIGLNGGVGYHRAHGVAGNADFVKVDECPRSAGVVDEVLHVHVVINRVDVYAGIAVTVCVARDNNKAAAGKLNHVLILMVKVVVAAVGQDDERELVFLGGFLGDIDLCVYLVALVYDYLHVLNFDGVEARHEQGREDAAYEAEAQRDGQYDFCAFLHLFFLLSFLIFSRSCNDHSIAFNS